jgi:orotate phosphoribosyltransferase
MKQGFFHPRWRLFFISNQPSEINHFACPAAEWPYAACWGLIYVAPYTERIISLIYGRENMKQELIEMLCRKSFQYSQEPVFKLVSGRMSHFYVNCKPTTLSPRGMYLVGHLMFEHLRDAGVTAVGGLTFGADPVAFAAAFASELQGRPIKAFSIRKTQKDHGIVSWVEGDILKEERVAIVDDVATTGGSTITAIERARMEGLEVVKALVLVDRQEGGLGNIRQHVSDASSIVTRDELLARWKEMKR